MIHQSAAQILPLKRRILYEKNFTNAPALASSNASPSRIAELPTPEILFEPEAMANAAPEASNVAPTILLKLLEPFPFVDFESKGASSFPIDHGTVVYGTVDLHFVTSVRVSVTERTVNNA